MCWGATIWHHEGTQSKVVAITKKKPRPSQMRTQRADKSTWAEIEFPSSRHWVAFLGTGTQNSWYISYAATYMCAKLIANTYSEGNMKRTLKRRLKVFEIAGNEADETSVPWQDCLCASLWQCPELFCYYTVHLCVVCCLARHLVLCMSNLWKAWFFVLCKGMLANGLNHSAIIYCSRICPPHMSLCLVVGVCQLIAMTRLCRSSRGNHS